MVITAWVQHGGADPEKNKNISLTLFIEVWRHPVDFSQHIKFYLLSLFLTKNTLFVFLRSNRHVNYIPYLIKHLKSRFFCGYFGTSLVYIHVNWLAVFYFFAFCWYIIFLCVLPPLTAIKPAAEMHINGNVQLRVREIQTESNPQNWIPCLEKCIITSPTVSRSVKGFEIT